MKISVVFALLFACGAAAQTDRGPLQSKGVQSTVAVPPVTVRVGRSGMPAFRIAAPDAVLKGLQPKTATFTMQYLNTGEVNYYGDVCVGWPTEAKAAFTYAATIWGTLLQSSVPIKISACWANMGTGGILGHGGARNYYYNFTGAPQTGTYYPIAIRNALAGDDANGTTEEIVIAYNGQFTSWYFGTDGACPANKIDFVQVIMHEMAHGLGFIGSMSVTSGQGSWGLGTPYPVIYDRYAENSAGQQLINTGLFPNPSAALYNQLISGGVYFDGPNANAANGGSRVKLYAPSVWSGGSSYAHLDELFNGTANTMMTYSVDYGESVHHPGPVTLGLLRDNGWPASAATLVRLGLSGSPMAEAGGTATVTATLSAAASSAVTVNLSFSGTATLTSDYTRSATSIVIPAGSLSGSVTLTAVQDALDEVNETVVVDIGSVVNATESGTQQVTATLTDDDSTVTFDSQSGTAPSPASKVVSYGSTYGTLATTTRAGYSFGGWWTAAGGAGAQVTAATTVTIMTAQTLYASWTSSSAPPAPTGVSATDGASTASVAVSWTASSGAAGYDVYRYTSDSSASASLLGSDIAGTAYTDSTATPGVIYYYWVKAKNAAGSSVFSASNSGYRALSAPTGVSATDTASSAVTVTWSASAGATYYRVYRATSAEGAKTALGGWQTALTYADSSAVVGTTYYYFVAAAVDASGTRFSAYSSYDTGVRPASGVTLVTALDNPSLTWTTGGNGNWAGQAEITHDGVDAAQSGILGNNQTTWIETTVTGPGTLTFWWMVSCEDAPDDTYDYLLLEVDGVETFRIDGEVSWQQKSVILGSGAHTLRWSYKKDYSELAGSDCGWVDQVVLNGDATLGSALDNTSQTWATGGNGSWGAQTVTTHDGVDAAQSGAISHNQITWMETTVTGPGALTFWWKVSCENDPSDNFDYLLFEVDGLEAYRIDGEVDWQQKSVSLSSGTHTLTWSYYKDESFSSGSDCGWVDQVVWTPSGGSTTTTEVPVPYSWLDTYGVVTGGNYEAAALADTDGDGHLTWQEYVAGTNPTNGTSVFKAGIDIVNGVRTVTWTPDLGAARAYSVEGKALITEAAWSSPTNAATRFFRVKVAVP